MALRNEERTDTHTLTNSISCSRVKGIVKTFITESESAYVTCFISTNLSLYPQCMQLQWRGVGGGGINKSYQTKPLSMLGLALDCACV